VTRRIGRRNLNLIDLRIDVSVKKVRSFGFLFAGLAAAASVYVLYTGSTSWGWPLAGAAFFLVTGLFVQPVLRPIYILWMRFAAILGWLNTRILLGVFYYMIVTPTGWVMRLLGKDLLDLRIDRAAKTYWKKRERQAFDPKRCERLF